MFKNIVAVLLLAGLVAWGVYDSGKTTKRSVPPPKVETKSQQNSDEYALPEIGLDKGNTAPDFNLYNLDGKLQALSDFRGKKVILNIWATWCPPCQAEIPDMEKYYQANKNTVVILGVNLTAAEKHPEDVKRFVQEFKMTYPVVLDEDGQVATMYEADSIPTSYFIDSKGIIRQKVEGPMNQEMMNKFIQSMQ